MNHVRLFISTVTSEFGPDRDTLRRYLTRANVEVKIQEDFTAALGSTLLKLDDYIQQCDAVIHLAGDATGAVADDSHVEDLRKHHPDLATRLQQLSELAASGNPGYSYTQWEAYLAVYHGKGLICARPAPGSPRASGFAHDPAQQAAQAAHLARLAALGRYPEFQFANVDRLIIEVLRSGLHDLLGREHRPILLPYQSIGQLFMGRDDFMARLRAELHANARAAAIVGKAVHGIGGAGKTRLAVEYARLFAADYCAVLSVLAESPSALSTGLAALSAPNALNLPEHAAPEEPVKTDAVIRWLQAHPGWLLLLDNVDTKDAAAAIEALLPQLHGGHVLITARYRNFSAVIDTLELDVLAEDDATAFLLARTKGKRRSTPDDEAHARALAKELDGLALALEQAGAYIAYRRTGLADYLAAWRAHDQKVQQHHDTAAMQYPRPLATTWAVTLDQLGPGEAALMRLLAFFGPEPIPGFVLEGEEPDQLWRTAAAEILGSPVPEAHTLPDALAELENYSMLQRDPDANSFTVHRVVQEVLRESLPPAERQRWLAAALSLAAAASEAAGDPRDVQDWHRWEPLHPHALAIADRAEAAGIAAETSYHLDQCALLLHAKALHAEAEPLMRRALEIDEKSYGKQHTNVAIRLNNLAALLLATNRLAEAEPLMRRALEIDEKSYGKEHPDVAIDLNNLAQLLQATNRLEEAEPLMRRALEIDEKSYRKVHPNVAIRLNNLAALLQATNRLAEAEPLLRRALEIDEKSYGKVHPNVARNLNNLAQLLKATNRLEEAEPLMQRALKIDEKSYGKEHPRVATQLNNLAQLLKATNRLEEAEPLMRRALEIDEKSYGKEHPNVARDLNNLAKLLEATNRLAEAEPLMRRQLEIFLAFTRNTGHEHPHLRAAIGNYWALLKEAGRDETEIVAELRALLSAFGLVLR